VVGLAACSSSSKGASSSPTSAGTPTSADTTTAPADGATVPAQSTSLEHLLIANVPKGFTRQADDVGDTGPSDLAKAIRDDDDPRAGKAFRAERFLRGYQRLWVGPKQSEILVFVYQFATAAGAKHDFERDKAALQAEQPPGSKTFSIPGFPAATSTAILGTSTDTSAAIALFTVGPYNAQVVSHGTDPAGLQQQTTKLATDQRNRLRAAG